MIARLEERHVECRLGAFVEPVSEADPFEPLLQAAARLVAAGQGTLAVAAHDGSRRPIGWLRAPDVARAAARDPASLCSLQVRSAMSPCVVICMGVSTPGDALQAMRGRRTQRLAAVDGEGRLEGSVSLAGVASVAARDAGLAREVDEVLAERSRIGERPPGPEVRDAMVCDVVACESWEPIEQVAARCYESDVACLPVLGADAHLIGVVSAWDLCRAIVSCHGAGADRAVAEAMQDRVASCWPDDSLEAAQAVMRAYRVRRLPVVDAARKLVGIVSLSDVARARPVSPGNPERWSTLETLIAIEDGWVKKEQHVS